MKELKELVRPNIWALEPYSSARDESKGVQASVFLDANESPFNSPFNRYPDPHQTELKQLLAPLRGVREEQLFLGNGTDEAIDLVYRCFCEPRVDNVVAIAPTYGMYKMRADVHGVEYRPVPLGDDFQFSADAMLAAADRLTKVMWLCSPNNPTGNRLNSKEIVSLLTRFWGIVVLDEAYIDFSGEPSFCALLDKFPNLIVLQTFSKSWASAAIRLGMAMASPEIITILNKVKFPHNVNLLTQNQAKAMLAKRFDVDRWVRMIVEERGRLMMAFSQLPICRKVYSSDANFFLARMTNADAIYQYLVGQGVVVRNRSQVQLCQNCLRITIGTKAENTALLSALRKYK